MRDMPRARFPEGGLLVAMLGEQASIDMRRAARRLRSEGVPALALEDDIAGLAAGLGRSEVSRSPAVLQALPPLFWLEARRAGEAGPGGISGWVVEKKRDSLSFRGFTIAIEAGALPEPDAVATVTFGADAPEDDDGTRMLRGLVTAISLPEMLSQMGEGSPVLLMPAEAAEVEASLLRGFRLSVAMSPDAAPH